MPRALLATLAVLCCLPAAASAADSTTPSTKRDKQCAKGARVVVVRKGTFRVVYVRRDGSIRAAACDTRYGKIILLALPGTNRNDGTASIVKRAGSRAILRGRRTNPRGPTSQTTDNFVDFKSGRRIVLERPVEDYAFLNRSGTFGYVDRGNLSRELRVLSLDGREDTVGFAPVASSPAFATSGSRVTFGPSGAPVTVDYRAMVARLRTCQPGLAGTSSARAYTSRDDATVRIWTDDKGIVRACPAAPTGELRLPCVPRDHAFAAPRLAIRCAGTPDTVAILNTATRTTLATHPLGGANLTARVAVSTDGLVAFTGRTDGTAGAQGNVLWIVVADGAAPQVVGEAGYSIRNVRFTAPRTLAWAELNREGGPDVNKTAAF